MCLKYFFALSILLMLSNTCTSQLDKGVWLVGGTGSFYSTKNSYTSTVATFNADAIRIGLNPSIGYVLTDKFAVGLRPGYTKTKSTVTTPSGGNTNENRLDIGPFLRYYFLEKQKQFNVLADISYQYGFYWFTPNKGNRNTFSVSTGTVVFFNSSIGLELLIGYYSQNETIKDGISTRNEQRGLQMMIGFQFHLVS